MGPELLEHAFIDRALERDDEARDLAGLDPSPGGKFGMGSGDVDVAVRAGEAHREPFLSLASPPAAPEPPLQLGRQVVVEPALCLADELGLGRADLLLELPQRRLARCLALVDA